MAKRRPNSDQSTLALTKIRHQKKRLFLEAFGKYGTVTAAARVADIHRKTHYDWLEADPDYVAAFAEASDEAVDRLEAEAIRRAAEGVTEPVYQGGECVGYKQRYSDTLLIFILKGLRPEKYRERHEISGPEGGAVQLEAVRADVRRALADPEVREHLEAADRAMRKQLEAKNDG